MYYHLGAFEDSVLYALGAGDLFDVNGHTEYIETTIGIKHFWPFTCIFFICTDIVDIVKTY